MSTLEGQKYWSSLNSLADWSKYYRCVSYSTCQNSRYATYERISLLHTDWGHHGWQYL